MDHPLDVKQFVNSICKPAVDSGRQDRDPFCFRIRFCINQQERDNYRIEPLSTLLTTRDEATRQERIQQIRESKPVVILDTDECVQIIDVHRCYSDPIIVAIKHELSSCTQCKAYKFYDCQTRYRLYAQRIEGQLANVVMINGEYLVYDIVREEWVRKVLKNRCFRSEGQEELIENVNERVVVHPVEGCEKCKLWKLRDCETEEFIYTTFDGIGELPIGKIIEGSVEGGDPRCYEVIELGWWEDVDPVAFRRTSRVEYTNCEDCRTNGGYIYLIIEECRNPWCDENAERNLFTFFRKIKVKDSRVLFAPVIRIFGDCYKIHRQVFPTGAEVAEFIEIDRLIFYSNCVECTNSGYSGNIYLIQDINKTGDELSITVAPFRIVNGIIYGPCGSSRTFKCRCYPPNY